MTAAQMRRWKPRICAGACGSDPACRPRADSALSVAIACCQGTPLRRKIEARAAGLLEEATRRAEAVIARRFGSGAVDGKIQAHVVMVEK